LKDKKIDQTNGSSSKMHGGQCGKYTGKREVAAMPILVKN
jgi:hypothetical protein